VIVRGRQFFPEALWGRAGEARKLGGVGLSGHVDGEAGNQAGLTSIDCKAPEKGKGNPGLRGRWGPFFGDLGKDWEGRGTQEPYRNLNCLAGSWGWVCHVPLLPTPRSITRS
jgi:hypothetical protein